MYLQGISSTPYGKGSNPAGGVWVEVHTSPQVVPAERALIPYFGGCRISARFTSHQGNIPFDGGKNEQWDRLAAVLGCDPVAWARAEGKAGRLLFGWTNGKGRFVLRGVDSHAAARQEILRAGKVLPVFREGLVPSVFWWENNGQREVIPESVKWG